MGTSSRIEAAGGVLWRETGGQIQIGVVHRDRYDDWSLPKGKNHSGELLLQTALREVGEETGSVVAVSRRLAQARYQVDGIDKVVHFWALRHLDGQFVAGPEVDELCWLDVDAARGRLSYADERAVLDGALASPLPTSTVVVVRHAKAGKRSDWPGNDEQRPLERTGRTQAKAVARLVRLFAPVRVIAANPLRCVQTVQPLADRLGLEVEVDRAFSDEVSAAAPDASRRALAALVNADASVAVCSQGDTIERLLGESATKSAAWVLGSRAGHIVSADYYGSGAHRRRS